MMARSAILDAARQAVTVDRAATHGDAEAAFAEIGALWGWYLGDRSDALMASDVAMMMLLFKLVRAKGNPTHMDNFIDLCGYAAIAGELAGQGE